MNLSEIIEKLEMRFKRLISFIPDVLRPVYHEIENKFNSRAILLYGARGTGKTTFLLYLTKKKGLFYVSADDPLLSLSDTYEVFQRILMENNGIIIDEVSFLKDWGVIVKALYDSFPEKTIWVSGSSSAIIKKAVADLSRRFTIVKLPLMSFREYIYFETGELFEPIENPFGDIQTDVSKIIKKVDIMKLFRRYREEGTRPFYLEGYFKEKLRNTIEKTLYYDVPYFVGSISENHLGVMKALISYIAHSKIPTINVERICKEWRIGKAKFYELLNVLETLQVLNVVRKKGKVRPFSKGSKIFFSDPASYSAYEGKLGNFREAFVVSALKDFGQIWACDDERVCDFIFNDIKIEVGGGNKKTKGADFVIKDDIDVPVKRSIPLWVLGMMW